MFKKITALALIFAMLLPVSSALAADEQKVTPTIEEILNSYHQKAFEAQTAEASGATTRSARSGKTLEEETVDELTAAGYEAYNVTGENYEALEEALCENFAAKGMHPSGNYIFIVHEPEDTTNANSRSRSIPEQEFIDDAGGSFLYYHEYYQKWYTMRKRTVVQSGFTQSDTENLHNLCSTSLLNSLADGSISLYVMSEYNRVRMGVTSDIFGIDAAAIYTCENLVLQASATWTRTFYDVWDEQVSSWCSPFYTEFANFSLEFTGRYYNTTTQTDVPIFADSSGTAYAPYYHNGEQLKLIAVSAFRGFDDMLDRTENLVVGFVETNGTIPTVINDADFIEVLTLYEEF